MKKPSSRSRILLLPANQIPSFFLQLSLLQRLKFSSNYLLLWSPSADLPYNPYHERYTEQSYGFHPKRQVPTMQLGSPKSGPVPDYQNLTARIPIFCRRIDVKTDQQCLTPASQHQSSSTPR